MAKQIGFRRLLAVENAYVGAVVIFGVGVVVYSLVGPSVRPIDLGWVALALLTLISGSFTVRVPGATSSISVSETFVIIAAVIYGAGPAAILVALEGLLVSLWILKNTKEAYRVFFNMATGAVSIWLSALLFFEVAPSPLVLDTPKSVAAAIPALFLFAAVYFTINSWLIAVAIGLSTSTSPLVVWKRAFVLLFLNYVSGASLATLLLPYIGTLGQVSLLLVTPLMVLAYTTFRTVMGRIADANAHLTELNKLYLSTIETLAMAIDAKDQITHGHVRRVQAYAVGLARAIGLSDENTIKAIEAAALLHDMGKLAIPEHILNKPGKLTAAEFETMKQHANIGADILSAIEFPYPVVPIVRYHHENWDGKGYPTGIRGEDIPIGARILAVVDCFDALTSDRPYRPRLSDADALKILHDRAGNMYDPELVQLFSEIYKEIAPNETNEDGAAHTHSPALRAESKTEPGHRTTADTGKTSATSRILDDLTGALSAQSDVDQVGRIIMSNLQPRMPVTTMAFFVYDQSQDELVARHAYGSRSDDIRGLRIPLGERISGWVGAARQTVVNSDPALDLGDTARSGEPPLLSCMSTVVEGSESILGVVSLYSSQSNAYSTEHQGLLEVVVNQASSVLQQLLQTGQSTADTSRPVGMPSDRVRLKQDFSDQGWLNPRADLSIALVSFPSHVELDEETVKSSIRSHFRPADRIYRFSGTDFVVLLSRTDRESCGDLVAKARMALRDVFGLSGVACGFASAPEDGALFSDLLDVARRRLAPGREIDNKTAESQSAVH